MNYSECVQWVTQKADNIVKGDFYNVACAPYQRVLQQLLSEDKKQDTNLTEEQLSAMVGLARLKILKELEWV